MQVSNKTFNLQQNYAPHTPPPEIRPIEPHNRLLEKVLLGNNHKKREVLSNFSFGTLWTICFRTNLWKTWDEYIVSGSIFPSFDEKYVYQSSIPSSNDSGS